MCDVKDFQIHNVEDIIKNENKLVYIFKYAFYWTKIQLDHYLSATHRHELKTYGEWSMDPWEVFFRAIWEIVLLLLILCIILYLIYYIFCNACDLKEFILTRIQRAKMRENVVKYKKQ